MNWGTELINFLKQPAITALFTAIVLWLLNEWGKRRAVVEQRKEDSYRILLEAVNGFYTNSQSKQEKDRFIQEYRKCFLYCPSSVIDKLNKFFETVHTDKKFSDSEKESALEGLVREMRKDLIRASVVRRIKYRKVKFKHIAST